MYRVGFTAGTFDMFHVGHLNLLNAAKEKCEYLIVGVNSDELVMKYKNKLPVIDVRDRLEVVNALKVVDQVELMENLDKIDAWHKFKFDCVFIGDDWKGSSRWIETERQLKEYGVDVCFLPYTKGVSSSKLFEKISSNEDEETC
jgi:glycerol-3-phosphate cytidylyltransferase